ncbi:HAMP domain-containing sensor histidine kinase [Vagococcus carniphilus]|uniref:sensor histidine kinase n=1 Tax=Vagococcus carniphilus TaxID=218144 RepID=UPI00288DCB65|nr:HAMP domain-containing sensor histidine kinase [Vagococcus carniphilus]MDT2829901.1 HAMP domain-containing sensor histidine kinase [Vagococcus carniphilus]MDT2838335.1 HAMP domain-containing sensor histidine kinase [Vagococcus carniphilus]MDT2854331.1 HAMP domain-containing sensor histidine kinase [Vagococcus carniphilus]
MKRKLIKMLIHVSTFILAMSCFILSYWLVDKTLVMFNLTFSWWLKQSLVTILGFVITSMIGRLFVNEKTLFITMKRMLKKMSQGDFDVDTKDEGKLFRYIDDDWDDFLKQLDQTSLRLKEMEELKQGFISDVSHEIRSPLTSIIGFTQLAKQENEDEKKRHYYLENIQEESLRLSDLSDSLLRLATLEENREIEKKTYSLNQQLEQVISLFNIQLAEKEMTCHVKLEPCLYEGNEELMYQVWQNLIGNAIRFSSSQDTLFISLTTDDEIFTVSIKDTGIGMDETQKNRIFERFYKADTSRTSVTGGSGLGLSIVSKIVEYHGDLKIDVLSEKGIGTTFKVVGKKAKNEP